MTFDVLRLGGGVGDHGKVAGRKPFPCGEPHGESQRSPPFISVQYTILTMEIDADSCILQVITYLTLHILKGIKYIFLFAP